MTIKYQPKNVVKRMASKKNVKRLMNKDLTIKKATLNAIDQAGVLSKKELEDVALKVLKDYRERVDTMREQGYTKTQAIAELQKDPKLLVQRIQNATVNKITKTIQEKYHGEYFIWLPSTAANPDPEHQKKYGRKYRLGGKKEVPGERFGCQCGMEILVKSKRLKLE